LRGQGLCPWIPPKGLSPFGIPCMRPLCGLRVFNYLLGLFYHSCVVWATVFIPLERGCVRNRTTSSVTLRVPASPQGEAGEAGRFSYICFLRNWSPLRLPGQKASRGSLFDPRRPLCNCFIEGNSLKRAGGTVLPPAVFDTIPNLKITLRARKTGAVWGPGAQLLAGAGQRPARRRPSSFTSV